MATLGYRRDGRKGATMKATDRGSSVLFTDGCIQIAELQFTGDFGRVLLVNPNCVSIRNARYLTNLDSIRPEYKTAFDQIVSRWRIDRLTVRKRV